MNTHGAKIIFCFACILTGAAPPPASIEQHVAKAREAAGNEYQILIKGLCPGPIMESEPIDAANRKSWHVKPARVFDNLAYVGQKTVSAWAIKTTRGIILIDALFDYSVQDEILDGLRKLGMDPKDIRYVIVTHGHSDHLAGAALMQGQGATILMSQSDWQIAKEMKTPLPRRDVRFIPVTVRRSLVLGDTTIDIVPTPGHTKGTLSVIFPVMEGAKHYVAAIWGGTGFNTRTREQFLTYAASARAFDGITQNAGVNVPLSNHPMVDSTFAKLDALRSRKAGQVNPFVTGSASQHSLLTTAAECADAALLSSGR